MFDPEHKEIDCPKCLRRKIYFDRKIGYYCMFCGYELSVEEALLLIEKAASTAEPTRDSGKRAPAPIVEINKPRARSVKTEHVSQNHDTPQHKKPE